MVVDLVGLNRDLDQFSPILPHGGGDDDPADSPDVPNPADDPPNLADDDDASPDDDASLDDDSPDDSTQNPQDSLDNDSPLDSIAAAAVQAASRAQLVRRSADVADVSLQIAAAHQRDVLETKISERVGGIDGQIESAERDGMRPTDEEQPPRRRMELKVAIMTKASIVMLMVTAGLTIYLVTFWHSLPVAVQCLVVVTFAWLAGAMTTIVLQHSTGGEEGEDDETARGQWLADNHASSARGRSSPGTAVEPWQNKTMKSASVTFLLLLLATVAFVQYSPTHPCSAHKKAVDAYCDDDQTNMDECFSTCMDERGTQDDVIGLIETPPCPQLADTSCACIKKCASRSSSDACSKTMIARLECNLANEHGCTGHACPKSSFAWTSTRMERTKNVTVRLRNAGTTGKEKVTTFAKWGLGATKDVPKKLHKAGIRNEKDATSASRELVARAVGISAELRKMGA